MKLNLVVAQISGLVGLALADTPADCHYEALKGKWQFNFSDGGHDNTVECDSVALPNSVEIEFGNINEVQEVGGYGNKGWFTLIYQQGFEVVLNERKWFAYFWYDEDVNPWDPDFVMPPNGEGVYDCARTMPGQGWVHDVLSNDWACFEAVKIDETTAELDSEKTTSLPTPVEAYQMDTYRSTPREKHPSEHMQRSRRNTRFSKSHAATKAQLVQKIRDATLKIQKVDASSSIPQDFDWNDSGKVSPVKDQGHCGSCYAFASVGMFEARARVQTNNAWQPIFSEQDIASCSQYSQNCNGGFPYLISKYAQDFGIVEEQCLPYSDQTYVNGTNVECIAYEPGDERCARHRVSDYGYVGDHYGGATEYLMRQEILENGPIAVSMDANYLHDYDGGVWVQPSDPESLKYDPYEYTNHVVLITGWGWEDGLPFWNVKNSWSANWGEAGYFRIIRGIDNADIESLPAKCTMIPPISI